MILAHIFSFSYYPCWVWCQGYELESIPFFLLFKMSEGVFPTLLPWTTSPLTNSRLAVKQQLLSLNVWRTHWWSKLSLELSLWAELSIHSIALHDYKTFRFSISSQFWVNYTFLLHSLQLHFGLYWHKLVHMSLMATASLCFGFDYWWLIFVPSFSWSVLPVCIFINLSK